MGYAIINHVEFTRGRLTVVNRDQNYGVAIYGRTGQRLKKKQGQNVKQFRRKLQQAGIPYQEHMAVNMRLGDNLSCPPGQMQVLFTW